MSAGGRFGVNGLPDGVVQAALERLRESSELFARAEREVAAIAVSRTAPRNAMRVTVGARGEIVELSFPTEAYRSMAPAELAALVKDTVTRARSEAADEATAALASFLPPGYGTPGSGSAGESSWAGASPDGVVEAVQRLLAGDRGIGD
jgi:hypothetical protein